MKYRPAAHLNPRQVVDRRAQGPYVPMPNIDPILLALMARGSQQVYVPSPQGQTGGHMPLIGSRFTPLRSHTGLTFPSTAPVAAQAQPSVPIPNPSQMFAQALLAPRRHR